MSKKQTIWDLGPNYHIRAFSDQNSFLVIICLIITTRCCERAHWLAFVALWDEKIIVSEIRKVRSRLKSQCLDNFCLFLWFSLSFWALWRHKIPERRKLGWTNAYCIKKYKIRWCWTYQKIQTATKKYFSSNNFHVDVYFLMLLSSSKNDAKKGFKTGKIDPFTTKYHLIIPKQ